MKKLLIFCLFTLVSRSISAQNTTIKQVVSQYEKALINKDYTLLDPLLSEKFSIGIYQQPHTKMMLKKLLKNYIPLDSLQLKEITQTPIRKATITYFLKDQKPYTSSVVFNSENKIVYIDLYDQLYGVYRHSKAKKVAEIPFKIINNGIALEVSLNNSKEKFLMLFDTGADGMALTEEAAAKANIQNIRDHQTSVVGGKMAVKFSSGNTIHLDTLSISNQNLVVFPKLKGGYDGIIGGNIIKHYITKVNFDTKTISLFSFGKYDYASKGISLPMDYSSLVPALQLGLHFSPTKTVHQKFVFDTGAGYNLIVFSPFVKKEQLIRGFPLDYMSTNHSFGHVTRVYSGDIPKLSLGNYSFMHPTIALQWMKDEQKKWTSQAGSLGMGVIQKFNFTINLLDKKIHLTPNTAFNTPFDFFIKGLILSFDNQKNLFVKNVLQGSAAYKKSIRKGAKIHSINGFEANELYTKTGLNKLLQTKEKNYTILLTQNNSSKQIIL